MNKALLVFEELVNDRFDIMITTNPPIPANMKTGMTRQEMIGYVKTALNRLVELEDIFSEVKSGEAVVVSAETSGALDVIIEKSVDVHLLKVSVNLNDYNWCVHTKDRALTQEEYDLLKDMLL